MPSADPIVIDIDLTPEDWEAVGPYTIGRLRKQASRWARLLAVLLWAIPTAITLLALTLLRSRVPVVWEVVGVFVVVCCFLALARRRTLALRPKQGSLTTRSRLELDASGVRSLREHQSGFTDWRAIQSIDETPAHVFLPLDIRTAYVIPKRAVVSMSPDALVAQLRAWHVERRATLADIPVSAATADAAPAAPLESEMRGPVTAPATPADYLASSGATPRRFGSGLRANLFTGLRAFLFRRVDRADFEVSVEQTAALLGIALVVAAVLDWLGAGPADQLVPINFYTWSALLLLGLWACAIIARVSIPRVETRALLVIALSIAPWALIVACACSFVPALTNDDSGSLLLMVALLIVLWGSLRVIVAAYGSLRVTAFIVILASIAAAAVADNYLSFDPHLWEQVAADNDEETGWQDAESTFYDQPGFIDESLQKLAPQRPGITDLYYVAFAGDGDQRVFRREALFGAKVFATRMGTGPRSLELINDRESHADFPLATVTGLRYSLSQLAKQMDPKEDVLVLFLTSHGSREGGIYVHTGVTPVDNDLPPDDVRNALDDAGIRWRIVIVSACYAGVFVEPLKSDTTMIITAADSRNTSFGCADDRDLTYFGEAFLRDSLPKAPSLEAAFELARKEIAERETEEKLTPSNPQMWVGASMSQKLAKLGPLPLAAAIPTSSNK